MAQRVQLSFIHPPQVEERLVDGIYFRAGHHRTQGLLHPLRHIAVKHKIAGEDRHIVSPDHLAQLIKGLSHLDTQLLGLVGTGDDAAVIVGQDDHWAAVQPWVEDPFARDEKVVAIGQPIHSVTPFF